MKGLKRKGEMKGRGQEGEQKERCKIRRLGREKTARRGLSDEPEKQRRKKEKENKNVLVKRVNEEMVR